MARVQVQQRNARVAAPVECKFIETVNGQVARARVVVISHHVRRCGEAGSAERTSIRWTVWGRLAETVSRTLVVGSHVNVVGRMQGTRYPDGQAKEVFGFDFTAEQIDFLERREVAQRRREQATSAHQPTAAASEHPAASGVAA